MTLTDLANAVAVIGFAGLWIYWVVREVDPIDWTANIVRRWLPRRWTGDGDDG